MTSVLVRPSSSSQSSQLFFIMTLLLLLLSSLLMSASSDKSTASYPAASVQPVASGDVISVGEWITVRDNSQQDVFNPVEEVSSGLSARPLLRWGLGAIIIMLIVSTALSIGQKLFPSIIGFVNGLKEESAEGRSLSDIDMSTMAQFAFQAFEKYATMNEE